MVVTMGGKDHHIKLAGTTEEPYFCGKDVCETLGYENESIKTTLFKLVEPENWILRWRSPPHLKYFSANIQKLSFNDGRAVYINTQGFKSFLQKTGLLIPIALKPSLIILLSNKLTLKWI